MKWRDRISILSRKRQQQSLPQSLNSVHDLSSGSGHVGLGHTGSGPSALAGHSNQAGYSGRRVRNADPPSVASTLAQVRPVIGPDHKSYYILLRGTGDSFTCIQPAKEMVSSLEEVIKNVVTTVQRQKSGEASATTKIVTGSHVLGGKTTDLPASNSRLVLNHIDPGNHVLGARTSDPATVSNSRLVLNHIDTKDPVELPAHAKIYVNSSQPEKSLDLATHHKSVFNHLKSKKLSHYPTYHRKIVNHIEPVKVPDQPSCTRIITNTTQSGRLVNLQQSDQSEKLYELLTKKPKLSHTRTESSEPFQRPGKNRRKNGLQTPTLSNKVTKSRHNVKVNTVQPNMRTGLIEKDGVVENWALNRLVPNNKDTGNHQMPMTRTTPYPLVQNKLVSTKNTSKANEPCILISGNDFDNELTSMIPPTDETDTIPISVYENAKNQGNKICNYVSDMTLSKSQVLNHALENTDSLSDKKYRSQALTHTFESTDLLENKRHNTDKSQAFTHTFESLDLFDERKHSTSADKSQALTHAFESTDLLDFDLEQCLADNEKCLQSPLDFQLVAKEGTVLSEEQIAIQIKSMLDSEQLVVPEDNQIVAIRVSPEAAVIKMVKREMRMRESHESAKEKAREIERKVKEAQERERREEMEKAEELERRVKEAQERERKEARDREAREILHPTNTHHTHSPRIQSKSEGKAEMFDITITSSSSSHVPDDLCHRLDSLEADKEDNRDISYLFSANSQSKQGAFERRQAAEELEKLQYEPVGIDNINFNSFEDSHNEHFHALAEREGVQFQPMDKIECVQFNEAMEREGIQFPSDSKGGSVHPPTAGETERQSFRPVEENNRPLFLEVPEHLKFQSVGERDLAQLQSVRETENGQFDAVREIERPPFDPVEPDRPQVHAIEVAGIGKLQAIEVRGESGPAHLQSNSQLQSPTGTESVSFQSLGETNSTSFNSEESQFYQGPAETLKFEEVMASGGGVQYEMGDVRFTPEEMERVGAELFNDVEIVVFQREDGVFVNHDGTPVSSELQCLINNSQQSFSLTNPSPPLNDDNNSSIDTDSSSLDHGNTTINPFNMMASF